MPRRKGGKGRGRGRARGGPVTPPAFTPPPKQWYEGIEDLSDLRSTHLVEIYHLDRPNCTRKKRKKNCETNPNCLYGLGEEEEGIWADQPEAIDQLGPDRSNDLRENDSFVGLENLGATCYMNSLLQCLFMNKNFRQGVYDWAAEDEEASQEESQEEEMGQEDVCLELQRLFTTLQASMRRSYAPRELTRILNLKTSIQQDAQEFNKLFISHLEERYARSKTRSVRELMEQFQGKYAYVTVCDKCHNVSQRSCSFYELELNINKETLQNCLTQFLSEERLVGSNQYYCEACSGLQDATRSIVLLELPEVLNFQLLRFVYDLKTATKKKVNNQVAFPLTLDMGQFLYKDNSNSSGSSSSSSSSSSSADRKRKEKPAKEASGSPSPHVYKLTAVLIHIGQSANGGHYVAHIRDESTNKWWRFDDATVTPLEEEMIGKDTSTSSKRKSKKQQQLKEQGFLQSANAYMLIYTQQGRKVVESPSPPSQLQKLIEEENERLLEEVQLYTKLVQDEKERIDALKQGYNSNISQFHVHPNTEQFSWISKQWFKGWVCGHPNLGPIDNSRLICPHNKVDPLRISSMKRISTQGWGYLYSLYEGGPALTQDDLCLECCLAKCKEMAAKAMADCKKKEVEYQLKYKPKPQNGFWISSKWLAQWRRKNPPDDLSLNMTEDITCEHGRLHPSPAGRLVVPVLTWSYLRSLYPEGNEYPSSFQGCTECEQTQKEMEQLFAVRSKERAEERKQVQEVQRLNNAYSKRVLPPGKYHLVSAPWLAQWSDYVENLEVDTPPGEVNNNPLFCPHALLLYDVHRSFQLARQHHDEENESVFGFVTDELWFSIMERYEGGPPAHVVVPKNEKEPCVSNPLPCEECCRARKQEALMERLNFKDAVLIVNVTREPSATGRLDNRYSFRRKSKTQRIEVEASSTDTIKVLRLKIFAQSEVAPQDQKLFFGDLELVGEDKLLSEFQVPRGATLSLEVQPDQNLQEFLEKEEAMLGMEEGFKGTNLCGSAWKKKKKKRGDEGETIDVCDDENGTNEANVEDDEEEEEEEEVANEGEENGEASPMPTSTTTSNGQWQCPHCTFFNEPSSSRSKRCQVCNLSPHLSLDEQSTSHK